MTAKDSIYHVYDKFSKNSSPVAHSLSFDELIEKVKKEEINLHHVDILELKQDTYIMDPSY
ncbi:hypothetical protein EBS02_01085 [bacterium]|nr:hypothetical protein [bacterium]